jgi:hypothetical protein
MNLLLRVSESLTKALHLLSTPFLTGTPTSGPAGEVHPNFQYHWSFLLAFLRSTKMLSQKSSSLSQKVKPHELLKQTQPGSHWDILLWGRIVNTTPQFYGMAASTAPPPMADLGSRMAP